MFTVWFYTLSDFCVHQKTSDQCHYDCVYTR